MKKNALNKKKFTLGKSIVVIVSIVSSLCIVFVFVRYLQIYFAKVSAKQNVVSSRSVGEKRLNAIVSQRSNLIRQSKIISSSIGLSKTNVCYISHDDEGLFAKNWYQKCYLRYVEGYYVDASKDSVEQTISNISNDNTLFGKSDNFKCNIFSKDFVFSILYRPASGMREKICEIPDKFRGVLSIKGPVLPENLSIEVIEDFKEDGIDNSKNQIWLTHNEEYYSEELGCGVGIIFCDNPRPKPINP